MRIYGILSRWNDQRGFGFITPNDGSEEVFVHISAFPPQGLRPKVGDRVLFTLEVGDDGKRRAGRAEYPTQRSSPRGPIRNSPGRKQHGPGRIKGFLALLLVMAGVYAFSRYPILLPARTKSPVTASALEPSTPDYQCDGRTRCPQMSSCEEAMFFIRHCPDTKMDGDNDGIPCEDQWCWKF